MIRWLAWILAGVLLGGIVHLSTILLLPRTATRDAYTRLLPMTETNKVTLLPFMDSSFAIAVCRYDLTASPVKLQLAVGQAYTSISFYTRQGHAFYAINDRAAAGRTIELDLMTPTQHNQMQEDEEVTAADRLIVESPTETGLILFRALATEPGVMPTVRGILSAAQCHPQPQQSGMHIDAYEVAAISIRSAGFPAQRLPDHGHQQGQVPRQ
jgi:uncharacterized membrane protein